MSRRNVWFITFVALSFGVACNSGEFGGGTKKAAAVAKKDDAATTDKNDKNDKNNNSDLGKPSKDDKADGPGDDANNSNTGTGTGNNDNISDVLNGLLGGDQSDAVSQPSDDEIIYGGTKVFHIGDSQMDTTSCQDGINQFTLAGRRYYFEFEVLEADTTVNIQVNRICGVDYSDTNTLALAHSGAYVQQQKLVPGATNATMATSASLSPGRYAIAIESKVGSADAVESVRAFDADDYIVGEIRIKASKSIKPGKVGAQ